MILNKKEVNTMYADGIHIIRGGFVHEQALFVINKSGNTCGEEKNGIAHFTEHVLINTIVEELDSKGLKGSYDYIAYTDYSHIVLQLKSLDIKMSTNQLVQTVLDTIQNLRVSEKIYEESENQIINEYYVRISSLKELSNLYCLLTNQENFPLLIGDYDDIMSFDRKKIENYSKDLIDRTMVAVFINENTNEKFTSSLYNRYFRLGIKMNNKSQVVEVMPIKFLYEKKIRKLKIVIHDRIVYSIKEKILQLLHELIIIVNILNQTIDGENELLFSQMSYSESSYLRIVEIMNMNKEIIHAEMAGNITEELLKESKDILIDNLNVQQVTLDVNEKFVTDIVLRHFKYGDIMGFNPESVSKIINVVRTIDVNELTNFCRKNYSENNEVIYK